MVFAALRPRYSLLFQAMLIDNVASERDTGEKSDNEDKILDLDHKKLLVGLTVGSKITINGPQCVAKYWIYTTNGLTSSIHAEFRF